MKLNKRHLGVVKDLADWSNELVICTTFSKDGFSQSDYREWLKSVSRFLRVMEKYGIPDIIVR